MPTFIAYAVPPISLGILLLAFWACLVIFLTLVVVAIFAWIEGGYVRSAVLKLLGICTLVLLVLGLLLNESLPFSKLKGNPSGLEMILTFSLPVVTFVVLLVDRLKPRK